MTRHEGKIQSGGTVCEQGTFRELMARDGYFQSLFTISQDAA